MVHLKPKLPNRLSKNNKGVTLVEVIAVIAVMSVVMAAVTGFMITGARMSAQVSGGATAGMREQTAAEYINQRLWEADPVKLVLDLDTELEDQETGEKTGRFATLDIDGIMLTTTDDKVTYNGVELCSGEIYFEKSESKDVIVYILNDVEHVVHLRIASAQE